MHTVFMNTTTAREDTMSATTAPADFTDEIARRSEQGEIRIDRDEAIKAIRAALKRRSGKSWSVTGDRGTAWGWLRISAPPARCTGKHIEKTSTVNGRLTFDCDHIDCGERTSLMTPADAAELAELLGLDDAHAQGISVASSHAHYIEYVARAEGRTPAKFGQQYWD